MLNDEEKNFVEYWEANRERQNQFVYQLLSGLPFGLIFALPVLVAVIFHDWYKSMIYISPSQLIVVAIGVLIVSVFFAVFRMKVRWDQNEQQYKELKYKDAKDHAAHL